MELLKSGAADESTVLRKAKFYDDKSIDRRAGLTVDAIDPDRRTVQLSDGIRHCYHRLVIATGSRARTLTVPGAGLPGVRVSITGAGYIGLEIAAAAARNCVATVLEFRDRVMSRVTPEPVYRFFEQLHGQHGVRFVFGAAVTAVEGSDRAEEVVTADGAVHTADVVRAGIGVVPNRELAGDAGLECQDGILVDEDGWTSVPDIYATGDVTRFTSTIDGASQRLECIQKALTQADRVAAHIPASPPPTRTLPGSGPCSTASGSRPQVSATLTMRCSCAATPPGAGFPRSISATDASLPSTPSGA
ncbi:hypothetical protein ASPU41_17030 [Arthrobacter sp. U41]|nr:NAD(P)/FAD-dependent oxidoreductase [Arthrobacter sp. U41]AOT04770.1 hypothetical protein ASPU41_17030 [Arthrobacter sp. U41]